MFHHILVKITRTALVILALPLVAIPALNTITYNAAGVLPVFTKNNTLYAVLSREAHGKNKGTYDSFAGSRDAHEKHPMLTAAREGAEEMISHKTMGLSVQQMKKYIDPYKPHTTMVLVHQRFNYVLYITQFDHYIHRFLQNFYYALETAHHRKYREKDRIAIVAWDDLKEAIIDNKNQVRAQVYHPTTHKPYQSMITVRPVLIKCLRPLFKEDPYKQGNNGKIRYY